MPRFDEYVKSNETPLDLCMEIEKLQKEILTLSDQVVQERDLHTQVSNNYLQTIKELKEQIEALTNINVKAQAIIAEQKE